MNHGRKSFVAGRPRTVSLDVVDFKSCCSQGVPLSFKKLTLVIHVLRFGRLGNPVKNLPNVWRTSLVDLIVVKSFQGKGSKIDKEEVFQVDSGVEAGSLMRRWPSDSWLLAAFSGAYLWWLR